MTAGGGVGAAPVQPQVAELRRAYLDLLKLALCDLAGTSTSSVQGRANGTLVSRELSGEELAIRAEGRDWPLHGLTMTGLARLNGLQACVEAVVRDGIEGDLIEAGTWRGGSAIMMRATLDALGAEDRAVWIADSFQGFPTARIDPTERGYEGTLEPYFAAFEFLSVSLQEVQANFRRFGCEHGTRFVPGFFEETMPGLAGHRWSLIRLDSDGYDSTLLALNCLYPGLAVGGHLLIDDYGALEECRVAVDHFRAHHGIDEPLEQIDWTCFRWQRRSATPLEADVPAPEKPRRQSAPDPGEGARHIATAREVELAEEAAALRERLEATEAELARTRDSLERQLRELTESISWRLTRPLRQLNARRIVGGRHRRRRK